MYIKKFKNFKNLALLIILFVFINPVLGLENGSLDSYGYTADDWIEEGNNCASIGQYGKALECYNNAIELEPNNDNIYIYKAYLLYDLGRDNEALNYCDKAIGVNPTNYLNQMDKGYILHELSRYEEAIVCYDKSIQLNDSNYISWYRKGNALQELSRYEEAIQCYDKALELDPNNVDIQNNKKLAEEFKSHFVTSNTNTNTNNKNSQNNGILESVNFMDLNWILILLSIFIVATIIIIGIKQYNKKYNKNNISEIKNKTNNNKDKNKKVTKAKAKTKISSIPKNVEEYKNKSAVKDEVGIKEDVEKAPVEEKIINNKVKEEEVKEEEVKEEEVKEEEVKEEEVKEEEVKEEEVKEEEVKEEEVKEEEVKEEEVKEEEVKEEEVKEEETPKYWFNLANMTKDNDEKIKYYDKALEINPNYESAISGKGKVLKSIKELEKLEEIKKNKETAKKFCKLAYGEKDKATQLKYYEKALNLDSDNTKILLNCAVAHHNLKEYHKALYYYDKALEINPDYESAISGKKIVSKLLKQIEDAKKLCKLAYDEKDKATQLKYYEKALNLDSDNTKILLNCAVSHYNLKNYKICKEYALKVLKIDKNNSKAKELVELCTNKK